jgi:hypothetical protein
MGDLLERVKLSVLVNGDGVADAYKKNSLYFYEKYRKSDKEVAAVPLSKIQAGRFYFFHYMDDSNWMKWSPVFVITVKKFENLQIVFAINLNFVPLEVRTTVFDNVLNDVNFEKDTPLKVDMKATYEILRRLSFEYSICEYNLSQIKLCHKIEMNSVPRFLYSGYPKNKYDAKKLYFIWKAKLINKNKRDAEISQFLLKDFYETSEEISNKYDVLKGHIKRVKASIEKYGRQS